MTQGWISTKTSLPDLLLKIFYYGPYILLTAGAVRLWRRCTALRQAATRSAALYEVALFGIGAGLIALVTLNRPQDYVHLAVLYWPLVCLTVVDLDALTRWRVGRAIVAISGVLALVMAGFTAHLVQEIRTLYSEPIALARGGVRVQPAQARLFKELVGYVQERVRPDQTLAAIPYYPLLNFLADRRGPHRAAYIVWPFAEIPDRDQQVVDAMDAQQTPVVIYHFTNRFLSFPPFEEYAPSIYQYLVDRYQVDRVFSYDAWDHMIEALTRAPEQLPGRPIDLDGAAMRITRAGRRVAVEVPLSRETQFFAETTWPFQPVLALTPAPGGATAVSFDVEPAAGEHLSTAVGLHPDDWFQTPPAAATFSIAVEVEGIREMLYERTLRPTKVLTDRGWFPVDLSLDRWVGRRVKLVFETRAVEPGPRRVPTGGWALPRLAP
jgi:hypothetical protein